MENRELFDRTVSVLVKAYFEGTLEHFDCCACAVGNLVSAAKNYSILGKGAESHVWETQDGDIITDSWGYVHCGGEMNPPSKDIPNWIYNLGLDELRSTGYTEEQTLRIERAFEVCDWYDAEDPQYIGLMSVIDELQKIHNCSDQEKEEAKALFNS